MGRMVDLVSRPTEACFWGRVRGDLRCLGRVRVFTIRVGMKGGSGVRNRWTAREAGRRMDKFEANKWIGQPYQNDLITKLIRKHQKNEEELLINKREAASSLLLISRVHL